MKKKISNLESETIDPTKDVKPQNNQDGHFDKRYT